MGQKIPKPGQKFRDFKNRLYQVLTVAEHSETKESLVIYQALYGEFKIYAKPLQRFFRQASAKMQEEHVVQEEVQEEIPAGLLQFLDAENHRERLQILGRIKNDITEGMLSAMAESMEIVLSGSTLEERYAELKECLHTYEKYEKTR